MWVWVSTVSNSGVITKLNSKLLNFARYWSKPRAVLLQYKEFTIKQSQRGTAIKFMLQTIMSFGLFILQIDLTVSSNMTATESAGLHIKGHAHFPPHCIVWSTSEEGWCRHGCPLHHNIIFTKEQSKKTWFVLLKLVKQVCKGNCLVSQNVCRTTQALF